MRKPLVAAPQAPEGVIPITESVEENLPVDPPVDPFDALLAAFKDTAPSRMVDPETGSVEGHGKPADDHSAARIELERHVQSVHDSLGPDHPEVERKRRLMNIAFR